MGALIGPGIGPCCYDVGEDVVSAFRKRRFQRGHLRAKGGPHVPRPEEGEPEADRGGRGRLRSMTWDLCTACRRDLFFSARRDKLQGRQINFVLLNKHKVYSSTAVLEEAHGSASFEKRLRRAMDGREEPRPGQPMTKHRKSILYILSILAITASSSTWRRTCPSSGSSCPSSKTSSSSAYSTQFPPDHAPPLPRDPDHAQDLCREKEGHLGLRAQDQAHRDRLSISMISSVTLFDSYLRGSSIVTMDKWFRQEIEDTVENARELSQFLLRGPFRPV